MIQYRFRSMVARTVAVVATIIMIASVGVPAYAGSTLMQDDIMMNGTGPENALRPDGQRAVLGPDETRWYTFRYAEGANGSESASEALAELTMTRPGSVSFEAWTEDDVRSWRNGEDFNPTGAGTPAFEPSASDNRNQSRLTWVGSGQATTTWYIVVSNETSSAAPYMLSVTGPDVYFPEAAEQMMSSADSMADSADSDAMDDPATMGASDSMTGTAAVDDSSNMDSNASMNAAQSMDMMDGIGPATALAPMNVRRTLAPGEERWYTFRYAGGADDENPSEAVAELAISRPNSIDFEVWTEDDVRQWANGEDFTPTGAGTPAFAIEDGNSDNRDRRLLRWVGSGQATTTWYIVVENNSDAAASYRLTVTGPDVFFPDSNAETAEDSMDEMDSTMSADADRMAGAMAQTVNGGTGPDDALSPMGMQRTLAPDETRWYTFDYTGGADDANPEEVIAELRMANPGSVSFEVWTEDDVRSWQNREDFEPTGAGTPAFTVEDDPNADNRNRSLLRWVGSGQAETTWYIVVENETDAPAPYRLNVSGPDVSFS